MNEAMIAEGIQALTQVDKDIARAVTAIGYPAPRVRPEGFAALFSIIVSQQVSTDAARAIMGRVETLLGEVCAAQVLATEPQALRDAGLSFRKIEYAKGLAEAVATGQLDIDALATMDDAAATEALVALRGFGRWSAEIYLMFSLGRPDIFPADDLALLVALGRLKGLPAKPTPQRAREMIAHWAPWRSVGALFLWNYYRGAPA